MISFLVESIKYGITLIYGATGEILTEKSGHLNLGIPGIMCLGGLGGCVGVELYGNMAGGAEFMSPIFILFFAILFASLFGGFGGLIYSFLTVSLRANQNITGLAITSFGYGVCKFFMPETLLFSAVSGKVSELFNYAPLGWFGELFFSYGFLAYLSIAVIVVTTLLLNKTRAGLHLRAIGENPATADAVGISVTKNRYVATVIGCAIAGIGGAYYFLDKMSGQSLSNAVAPLEALGWLAVALVIFSVWKPAFTALGAFIFGCCSRLGAVVFSLPPDIVAMSPYVITVIVLIITSIFGSKNVQPPASLGLNYFREER